MELLTAHGDNLFAFLANCIKEVQVLNRNVQRFRGGLAFKAHRLCVSLNSRLESNKEEERRCKLGTHKPYNARFWP